METLTGRLRRDELGGAGVWILTPDRGRPVQLVGAVDMNLEGCRVKVMARPVEQLGFAMVGPVYEVVAVHPA